MSIAVTVSIEAETEALYLLTYSTKNITNFKTLLNWRCRFSANHAHITAAFECCLTLGGAAAFVVPFAATPLPAVVAPLPAPAAAPLPVAAATKTHTCLNRQNSTLNYL